MLIARRLCTPTYAQTDRASNLHTARSFTIHLDYLVISSVMELKTCIVTTDYILFSTFLVRNQFETVF